MRLLDRYVFREVFASAAIGTLLATCIIFLQRVDKLFEVLVGSSSANAGTIAKLFLLALPPVLPLTIPFGTLVGILIGLGRMASDGEITAMRSAGVSSRRVLTPVLLFAALGAGLAAWASLRLTPYAIRESTQILNGLMATQLSAEIQPRVFDEDFPNTILYVGDVRPGDPVRWRNVFMADVTLPGRRSSGMKDRADGPLITVAQEAVALSDPRNNRLQLSLRNYSTHEMGRDGVANDASAPHGEQALGASPPRQNALASSAMNTRALIRYSGPNMVETRLELHRRFALPVACLMLALVGIPLGIATRKGGRSAGYVVALFLAFFCYHLSSISLIGLAKQRTISVPLAVWLPDVAFGIAGLIFLYRMERPGDRDLLGSFQRWFRALQGWKPSNGTRRHRAPMGRLPLLPQILDTYVLNSFLFYLLVLLASFVSLTLIYNFFELTGDMVRNKVPLARMFTYLFFLSPQLIYKTLPISILVAVLVAFGVLSKQNEITAFKACGVSLYRLALPVLIGSTLFSGALFAFDFYYVPGANRRQDALRDEIKGHPKQTHRLADRKWIMGYDSRIFYYRYFDSTNKVMLDANVFELDPATFALRKQILAERATWSPVLRTWIFENGWSSEFRGAERISYKTFAASTATFAELTEPPEYFLRETVPDQQMNFLQLDRYIQDLRQGGIDTVRLQVQFYRKFSVPLFALIMGMIAVPFAFMVGNRGAMTGIGVSIAIAVAYWGVSTLFEKIGDVNQLPPAVAAWSPNLVFSLAALYMMLRLKS